MGLMLLMVLDGPADDVNISQVVNMRYRMWTHPHEKKDKAADLNSTDSRTKWPLGLFSAFVGPAAESECYSSSKGGILDVNSPPREKGQGSGLELHKQQKEMAFGVVLGPWWPSHCVEMLTNQ